MILGCVGSGSKGNCYLLKGKNETLILEAGMPMQKIKNALGWSFKGVVGCIVTHEHNDHSRSVSELINCGIRVLALDEVFAPRRAKNSPLAVRITPNNGYILGGFKIVPLSVPHDVPCVAFVIEHKEMGRLLFVTDAASFDYHIEGVNHLLIEANYCDERLDESIELGLVHGGLSKRLLGTHMEIETSLRVARGLNSGSLSEVVLVHLSRFNSDAQMFIRRMSEAVGKPVFVAEKGFEMELVDYGRMD